MAIMHLLLYLLCSRGMCVSDIGKSLLTNHFPQFKHQISLFKTELGYSHLALKRQEHILEHSFMWMKLHLLKYVSLLLSQFVLTISSHQHFLYGPAGHSPINVIWKTHESDQIRRYGSQRHPGHLIKA